MTQEYRRITLSIPTELADRLDEYVAPRERSEWVAAVLSDYLDHADAEQERAERRAERRVWLATLFAHLREQSARAARALLPD